MNKHHDMIELDSGSNSPIKLLLSVFALVVLLCIFFVADAQSQNAYRNMYGKYQYNEAVRFVDSLFFKNLPGVGDNLVVDTITGEVRRDTAAIGGGGGGVLKHYEAGANLNVTDANDTVTYSLDSNVSIIQLISQTARLTNLQSVGLSNQIPLVVIAPNGALQTLTIPTPPRHFVFKSQSGASYDLLSADIVGLIAQSNFNDYFSLEEGKFYKVSYSTTFSWNKTIQATAGCDFSSEVFLFTDDASQTEGDPLNVSGNFFIDTDSKSVYEIPENNEENQSQQLTISGHSSYISVQDGSFIGLVMRQSGSCSFLQSLEITNVIMHLEELSEDIPDDIQNGNVTW